MMLNSMDDLMRHYGDVRARLYGGSAPAERVRRIIPVRAQTHRPDYVEPAPKLPMVRLDQAAKHRIRDVLNLRLESQIDPTAPDHYRTIISEVCSKHRVTKGELLSARRQPHLVVARHEAMYRMIKETSMSLPAIGRRMGGRDHTTVLYGIRKHAAKLEAPAT